MAKYKKYTLVGVDEYKNKYYVTGDGKRVCIYDRTPEASKIPPEWYVWMYKISECESKSEKYSWQIDHKPNTTGTKFAYFHKNSIQSIINSGIKYIKKQYSPWMPK